MYGGGEQLITAPALQAAQLPQAEVHLEEGEEGEVGVAVPAQEARPVLLVRLLLSGIRQYLFNKKILVYTVDARVSCSVEDPHHFKADPDLTYYLMRIFI